MIQFIVRRLIASIPVLLGVVIIVFVLVRVIPGDPCTATLGEKANAERCAEFNARIGLTQPIPIQLGIYLKEVVTLDLGTSTMFGKPVAELLLQRLQFGLLFDAVRHMILPAIALGTIPMAIIARMTRSSLLEVMGLDYVRTARAKGLRGRVVLFRHGLRNAMLPVVTVIGLSIGGLLSGAVLTETIFGLSGVGLTITQAITSRDYAVVQGFALFVALVYVVVNLLTDISYGYLDPRVRPS